MTGRARVNRVRWAGLEGTALPSPIGSDDGTTWVRFHPDFGLYDWIVDESEVEPIEDTKEAAR